VGRLYQPSIEEVTQVRAFVLKTLVDGIDQLEATVHEGVVFDAHQQEVSHVNVCVAIPERHIEGSVSLNVLENGQSALDLP